MQTAGVAGPNPALVEGSGVGESSAGEPGPLLPFAEVSLFSIGLDGKVAIVTGAGNGVGLEIAAHLARAGCEVWINDIDGDRATKAAEAISADGGGAARPVVADVTDGRVVGEMAEQTGPVDIVVNNAGTGMLSWVSGTRHIAFVDSGPEDWDPILRVNLAAVLGVTRAYLPAMLERGWGRVLTIVSDAGRKGERRQAVYGAAKAAAMGFSRGLAAEVGRDGVTVNCISLGTIRHGALADGDERNPERVELITRAYPAGRLGNPEDPAPLAVLLCSDAGAWITGQVYPVNGGYVPAL
ncbi:MAG: SDR family NAD(P)-dependent oxidoreductase [Acidimicrobiia bacterium]